MKRLFLPLLLLCMTVAANAQTLVKGDMNDDGDVTVSDVAKVVNVVTGKDAMETLSVAPYAVDNSYVVGTWYKSDGTSMTFNEDGTTDLGTDYTYKFRPYQGTLMVYDASGTPVNTLLVREAESTYLLIYDSTTGSYTYYTHSASMVALLTMNHTSLTINSNATAQLSVIVTPSDALNTDVTWTSSDESVATVDETGLVSAIEGGTCTITATSTDGSDITATCELTVIQMVIRISLNESSIMLTTASNPTAQLTASVRPTTAANTVVAWSSSDESVATVDETGLVTAVGEGTCTITCAATDESGVSTTCEVTVSEDVSGNVNGEEYVDLGLPSGTLWATKNVGASSVEDYGNYYAWGETTTKSEYSWSTYAYGSSSTSLTKYSTYAVFGCDDELTELETSDDAAVQVMGSAWRMPTRTQAAELLSSCTWTAATQNSVAGYLATGPNGNSIFLPASGYKYNSTTNGTGSYAQLWTTTLWNEDELTYSGGSSTPKYGCWEAYDLHYQSSDYTSYTDYGTYVKDRYYGLPVRAVRATATDLTLSETSLELSGNVTHQLTATITPADAYNSGFLWTTSNECVASVDDGLITVTGIGTCIITCTTANGSVSATCSVTVSIPVTSITLNNSEVEMSLGETSQLTATVEPSNANTSVTWSSQDETVATVSSTGLVTAVGIGVCAITCTAADGSGVSASCDFTVTSSYVDLGLSSGTLWATCNVGALKPSGLGDYFAWGETTPGKTDYSWETYDHCYGTETSLCKYCTESSYGVNGYTDGDTELEVADDAAYVNWGSHWRTPTQAQWEELVSECEWDMTQVDGVDGYLVSSTNGNSIFLPAAGSYSGTTLDNSPWYLNYWSRTLNNSTPSRAYCLYAGSQDDYEVVYISRYYGISVRPVYVP